MLRTLSISTLALAATGLVACGADSDPQYDQVATGLSAMMADPNGGESRTFLDAVMAARGDIATGLSLTSDGLVTGQRGELVLKYEFKCKDLQDAIVSSCDGAASADFKAEWKGKIDDARYKLEVDRKAEWKVKDFNGEIATINGHTSYHVKSDFKDHDEDIRHKYDFDFDAQYHDVGVRVSDGMLMSGRADFDLDAKEMSDDGTATIKTQLKVKTVVTFSEGNEAIVDLDSKHKYRIKLDSGDLSYEGRID
ncbi:MAG: hypothetical protein IT384_23655 [Deltaproteobacteria bacterium]|nr:hypothetical protein [Deltaproteobacteria bacterium]